jgi:hypothetical protein
LEDRGHGLATLVDESAVVAVGKRYPADFLREDGFLPMGHFHIIVVLQLSILNSFLVVFGIFLVLLGDLSEVVLDVDSLAQLALEMLLVVLLAGLLLAQVDR